MTGVLDSALRILSDQCSGVFAEMLEACLRSSGDLLKAEDAIEEAILSLRKFVVSSALGVCVTSGDRAFYCPECHRSLTHWNTSTRCVVTSSGEGTFPSECYRCRSCRKNYYPWQTIYGLDRKNQYTLTARQRIAEEAADAPFDRAGRRLLRSGISVSSAEIDRIACEVGTWRKQQEEAVRAFSCRGARRVSLPLHDWSRWPNAPSSGDIVMFSGDGAFVRSDQHGDDGELDWFEVRSGLIRLNRDGKEPIKFCFGGIMEPDQFFETLRAQWWQAPQAWHSRFDQGTRFVFVADGIPWIWERVGWYLPQCIQILDIYHAAANVGEAARAAWGIDHPKTLEWVDQAMPTLLQTGGPNAIMRALIDVLRTNSAVDADVVRTKLRYLWRHRHRMQYAKWRAEGLPIGSGAMESTIKQLNTQRLRQAGMKWSRKNADLMLHLRAAHLSQSLRLTVQHERQIRFNRGVAFRRTTERMAA